MFVASEAFLAEHLGGSTRRRTAEAGFGYARQPEQENARAWIQSSVRIVSRYEP
jgi:hypothetical protein